MVSPSENAPADISSPEPSSDDTPVQQNRRASLARGALGNRAASAMSLPLDQVPERRSSASILSGRNGPSRASSVQDLDFPSWRVPPPSAVGQMIPSRGRADSPVRKSVQRNAISSDSLRRSPSKTFIRTAPPLDILETSTTRHGRIDMSILLQAPVFVGGGTIEGSIKLAIDGGISAKTAEKPMFVSRLSIDIIGVEQVKGGGSSIFLALAQDLFDEDYPPPASMVTSQIPIAGGELFWPIKPASASVPFKINLPLNVGPPPYVSGKAGIRYFLCPSLLLKSGGKQSTLRQKHEVHIFTVHDPEKALASLPNPLIAMDTVIVPSVTRSQYVKITAGLHRQIWVNGAMIYVDVHVVNTSSKVIKKMEIQLEKTTLWYNHTPPSTAGESASRLRLPKKRDVEVVSTTTVKKSKDWSGVLPNSSEVRTCGIDVPKGHVSIRTGRYFEVRYFLNAVVSVSSFKRPVAVQLPITIIHMSSLDIVPNALAQVAEAIEAKRRKTVPSDEDKTLYPQFQPGQAFTAARRQSLDRMREQAAAYENEDVAALAQELDDSPRRYARASIANHARKGTMSTAISGNQNRGRPSASGLSHHHHTRHDSCYHCHLAHDSHSRRRSSTSTLQPGPKLPRLQVSTSGLGFSDTEFELANSPPKKVMLSEEEREMILQHREQKLQRENSRRIRRKPSRDRRISEDSEPTSQKGYSGWMNVAAGPDLRAPGPSDYYRRRTAGDVQRTRSVRQDTSRGPPRGPGPARVRSRTNPDRLGATSVAGYRRARRSADRSSYPPVPGAFDENHEQYPRPKRQPRKSLERP